MIAGITGASGSGKSTAAEIFVKNGFYLIDCDALSRGINALPEYISRISDTFGTEFIAAGAVDRKRLGAYVFGSPERLAVLNGISHPLILKKVNDEIASHSGDILIDAPLLFESGLDSECDITVGVIAPDNIRAERVALRDEVDIDAAKKRVASQKSNDFYVSHCDVIIDNCGTAADLVKKVREAIEKIRREGECLTAKE